MHPGTQRDDLDVPTVLRRAIASGDAVAVRSGPEWFPRVREAAAVCGRLDDLVVVVCGRLRGSPPRPPVRSFAMDPDRLRLGHMAEAASWRTRADPDVPGLPHLEFGDLARPSPIIVIHSRRHGPTGLLASELARIHLGLGPKRTHVRYLSIKGHPRGHAGSDDEATVNWIRPRRPEARAAAMGRDGAGGWTAAVSAYRSLPGPVVGPGMAVAERHGLVAAASPMPWVEDEDVGEDGEALAPFAVHVACAEGWIKSAMVWLATRTDDAAAATLARLAQAAVRGDVRILDGAYGTALTREREVARLRAHLGSEPVRDALSAHADIDALLAVPSGTEGRAVARAMRDGPAHPPARRDFVLTWPAVAPALLAPGVAARIDAGERTVPLVAAHLGVPASVARRVSSLPRRPDFIDELGPVLAAFGPDRLPRPMDRVEGEALCLCLEGLATVMGRSGIRSGRAQAGAMARLLSGTPGRTWDERWTALAPRLTEDAADLVIALSDWLAALGHLENDMETAFSMLAGHGGLHRLLGASERWHATTALSTWAADIPHDARWPVPFAPVDLGDGFEARALGTFDELRAEGARGVDEDGIEGLAHCVATYAAAAMGGASVIVSIRRDRDGTAERVSTAELAPDADGAWRLAGRRYALNQHKARENAAPPQAAIRALERLREGLATGRFPVDPAALDPREVPEGPPPRTQAEAILPLWRALLPRPYAAMDVSGLLAAASAISQRSPVRDESP